MSIRAYMRIVEDNLGPKTGGALPHDMTLQQEIATLGEDDLFEMANLPTRRTGIPGIVFISTAMASHGPRVKYFEKAGKGQPSFSVSISAQPEIVANSLPPKVLNKMAPLVIAWVAQNSALLLKFWNHADEMDDDAVTALKNALKPVSSR